MSVNSKLFLASLTSFRVCTRTQMTENTQDLGVNASFNNKLQWTQYLNNVYILQCWLYVLISIYYLSFPFLCFYLSDSFCVSYFLLYLFVSQVMFSLFFLHLLIHQWSTLFLSKNDFSSQQYQDQLMNIALRSQSLK